MPDVFDRQGQQFGGSFASDAAKLIFAGAGDNLLGVTSAVAGAGYGAGGVGLLTQNLQISYTQSVTRLYEIGTNYTFLVAGRTQGGIGIGRILGPRAVQRDFYSKYGNVCNAATNNVTLEMATGCPGASAGDSLSDLSMQVKNMVLTSIATTVAAQDMIVNEQLAAMFVSLEY